MIKIEAIPYIPENDNYGYIISNGKRAVVVDVGDGKVLNQALSERGLNLEAVLFTHHHWDHVDGFPDLDKGAAVIIGNKLDAHRLPKLDMEVTDGQVFEIAGMQFEVFNADGHTIGQIAYHLKSEKAIFTADSLMAWGCGRVFEGSPEVALATLERFARLPESTLIFSGHNYGETNGRFALSLDPDHVPSITRMEKIKSQNAAGEPIVPVNLAEEILTNPFLRVHDDNYAKALGIENLTPPARFAHIRKLRDNFK